MQIELVLANGNKFPQPGKIGAIEADFNNETGNIAFRADFPNPDGLLRHGQTGTVLIHRLVKNAIVIPQRATFEFSTSSMFTSSMKTMSCISTRSKSVMKWKISL